MKRHELENLKEKVLCGSLLARAGYGVDTKESTRRAVKWRRGAEIIIITHEGRGWFDPLSDAKGDVFSLAIHLDGGTFIAALESVASLMSSKLNIQEWTPPERLGPQNRGLTERWGARRRPWPGSATWRYLCGERTLPATVLCSAIEQDVLREGPYGSMWAAHTDDGGNVCGWEGRGPEWRGFAKGGAKILFRLGPCHALRLCVTEAAIDAMSLAAIEGMREGTLYLSTGGGWSPATEAAIRTLATRSDLQLVAATDANSQGDAYAHRLRTLAEEIGCNWLRLRPQADDWNEVLNKRERQRRERREERDGVPHSRRPRKGKLRPALPALDPAGRDAGGQVRVMKD